LPIRRCRNAAFAGARRQCRLLRPLGDPMGQLVTAAITSGAGRRDREHLVTCGVANDGSVVHTGIKVQTRR
jgi:hypothetical protein